MIFNFKRGIIFHLAGIGAVAFIAGCAHPKPQPPKTADVTPPIEMPAPAPAPTNNPALPLSHPRPPADAADNMAANILKWDAVAQEYQARPGETNAPFTFSLTNISTERVMIFDVSTTCDCTVAQLPAKPWTLAPGAGGQIHASLDMRNRTDAMTNYVIVFTSKGNRLLTVKGVPAKP